MSDQNNSLVPPRPIGLEGARDSMATTASADPSFKGHPSDSVVGLPVNELNGHSEKPKRGKRPLVVAAVGLAALAVVVVAVIVPVYYKVIKPKNNTAESSSSSGGTSGGDPTSTDPSGGGGNTPTSRVVTWGGDGSTITKDDGSTFTYNNKFGGFWVHDPANPFNNSARPQSWSPPLSREWNYGEDPIRGVNLGGWLVLEPFISPALCEPYQPGAIDEWTLCEAIEADKSSGGVAKVIEEHYKSFITEEDFAKIAAAGLNWVRIPIPYWTVEKLDSEPFLEGVTWK